MLDRWSLPKIRMLSFLRVSTVVLLVLLKFQKCCSINNEGLALLRFRMGVKSDPYRVLEDWNFRDGDPCGWTGIGCINGEVRTLDLNNLSLGGVLVPQLGKLRSLRSLVLCKNNFLGEIPKEIAMLTMLEVLDLRSNKLNGAIPIEIGEMFSLKRLLICDNDFQGSLHFELAKLSMLVELQYDGNLVINSTRGIDCVNGKFRKWLNSRRASSHAHLGQNHDDGMGVADSDIKKHVEVIRAPVHRKLLQSSNLAAASIIAAISESLSTIPSFGSGSFPANLNSPVNDKKSPSTHSSPHSNNPHQDGGSGSIKQTSREGLGKWIYIFLLPSGAFILTIAAVMLFIYHRSGGAYIVPWKTGFSGQLQKAFVTGVPKLNEAEMVIACEDFSNIISSLPNCTIFKGTLSSGVEIAVASTRIASAKDWSKRAEVYFRKKVDSLSRLNHKNFVNILGYCEENEPFLRMVALEYAPNGSLSEHLHDKELEHLDWASRMRIIMGVAYCLQYMHHVLNPPLTHPNLTSSNVLLTDDYAAKVLDTDFWKDCVMKAETPVDIASIPSNSPFAKTESNVYDFGVLMLEIISGKIPHCEEASLVNWALKYLGDRRNFCFLVDPTLTSFEKDELDAVSEVIFKCIIEDPRKRPTMNEVTFKLGKALGISSDAATPRVSPMWWAELAILSLEAT